MYAGTELTRKIISILDDFEEPENLKSSVRIVTGGPGI